MIFALSAYDAGNPGMLASNLALAQIVRDNGEDIEFLNLESNSTSFGSVVTYRSDYTALEINEADLVVGWGDFIHSLSWAKGALAKAVSGRGICDSSEAITRWFQLHMLEGMAPKRAISAGSTLYNETFDQLTDSHYVDALQTLSGRLEYLSFRDPVSVSLVKSLANVTASIGCDCALLLDTAKLFDAYNAKLPADFPQDFLVSSFGRSGMTQEQNLFAGYVAEKLGVRHVSLKWLDSLSTPDVFLRQQQILANAKYCISDIYHFCVSALREGVPTLCMSTSARADSTIDDEKKRLFFLSYGLRRYVMDPVSFSLNTDRDVVGFLIQKAARLLGEPNYGAFVQAGFRDHIAKQRMELESLIFA